MQFEKKANLTGKKLIRQHWSLQELSIKRKCESITKCSVYIHTHKERFVWFHFEQHFLVYRIYAISQSDYILIKQ